MEKFKQISILDVVINIFTTAVIVYGLVLLDSL